jgi:tryptophan synthase alpha chain
MAMNDAGDRTAPGEEGRRSLSPLEAALRELRLQGRAGLVPFVTAGFPTRESTVAVLGALERAGAAAVELGVPFSDPLADGPAIQRSSQIALENGVTVTEVLAAVEQFHSGSSLPVVLMSYINPILAHGPTRFARQAREAGVSGVILTDLPPEERPDVWSALEEEHLDSILLIAPTTDPRRRGELARKARGFIYCVSRTGVTGGQSGFARELQTVVGEVRRATEVPIGVGFGVNSAERARLVAALADAVIVGAAVCERLEKGRGRELGAAVAAAEDFVRELAGAVGSVRKTPAAGRP